MILQGNWVCVFGKNVESAIHLTHHKKGIHNIYKLIDQLKCKKTFSNLNVLWWSILCILQLRKPQLLKT
jgi:hypothetical protein